jgi:hypothetical protein
MPIECVLLDDAPVPLRECPECGVLPFRPFMRGQVQRWKGLFRKRPYCALICSTCKEIVGWEKPQTPSTGSQEK